MGELKTIKELCNALTPGPINHHRLSKQAFVFSNPNGMNDADAIFFQRSREDIPELLKEIERLNAECLWTHDGDNENDIWETSCGHAFIFEFDPPSKHGYRYCPVCRAKIVEFIRTELRGCDDDYELKGSE